MAKKNLITVCLITLVTMVAGASGIFLATGSRAPWRQTEPPYFTTNMGEKYKEIKLSEINREVSFASPIPHYRPNGLSLYRAAVKVGIKDQIFFYTNEMPGVEPGPPKGVVITIGPDVKIEGSLESEAKKTKVGESNAKIFFSLAANRERDFSKTI